MSGWIEHIVVSCERRPAAGKAGKRARARSAPFRASPTGVSAGPAGARTDELRRHVPARWEVVVELVRVLAEALEDAPEGRHVEERHARVEHRVEELAVELPGRLEAEEGPEDRLDVRHHRGEHAHKGVDGEVAEVGEAGHLGAGPDGEPEHGADGARLLGEVGAEEEGDGDPAAGECLRVAVEHLG